MAADKDFEEIPSRILLAVTYEGKKPLSNLFHGPIELFCGGAARKISLFLLWFCGQRNPGAQ